MTTPTDPQTPEPTPAVERMEAAWEAAYDAHRSDANCMRAALAAALDVEEMARALRDAECTGHDHGTSACPDRHCRDDVALVQYRALATHLRTHLLGSAS